ncbi:ATP-binding protein [Algibacter sp.]|nr:ATP-binding protein [Algibacter sp.]
MKNTFGSEAKHLGLRQSSIRHFCRNFGIKLSDQFVGKGYLSSSILKDSFIEYLKKNIKFLQDFQTDYYNDKSPKIISETIGRELKEIEPYLMKEYPDHFKDGEFIEKRLAFRYVSSYKIDYNLGGDYSFLLKKNSKAELKSNMKIKTSETNFIGYEDILVSIIEQIEPILNPDDMKDWGLQNPGGIILFGPPGCGKTFWAEKISQLIDYSFEEIPRSIFGSSLVDGAMINLKKKLNEYKSSTKSIIFFDEFDSIASIRNNQSSGSTENSKVVNTLLQEIPKLIEKQILIIAATNFIDFIDPAVVRPGRFDLKIPVFPPNIEERTELIVYKLINGLQENSPLLKILKFNNADNSSYWKKVASNMILFSNSLVIDYTQLVKRKLKNIYSENQTIEIKIDEKFLLNILEETASKLTQKDAEIYAHFYNEVKSLGSNFYQERLDWLFQDLERYFSRFKKPDKPRPIGFRQPDIE